MVSLKVFRCFDRWKKPEVLDLSLTSVKPMVHSNKDVLHWRHSHRDKRLSQLNIREPWATSAQPQLKPSFFHSYCLKTGPCEVSQLQWSGFNCRTPMGRKVMYSL